MHSTLRSSQVNGWVRLTLAVSSGLLFAFVVSLIVRGTGSYNSVVDGWGVAVFEVGMGFLCLGRALERTWRSSDSSPKGFPIALGVACISWGMGDLVLTFQYGGATPAVPSMADGFYIGFFPLAYLSFMWMIRRANAASLAKAALDGVIAGLGAASLSAAYLFHLVRASGGGGVLATATKMAYPVGDILLLSLAIGGVIVLPRQSRRFLVIATFAMAALATGDLFNLLQPASKVGYVANGAAWPAALLILATGVWLQPAHSEKGDTDRTASFALPALGAVASLLILATASMGRPNRAAIGLATATLAAAGVRLVLSVREGQALKSARFRSLIDNAWDIIVVAEGNFEVAYITPSAERVLGYHPTDLQGATILKEVHPDDAGRVRQALTGLPDGGAQTAVFETRMRHRNGAWRIIAWTATNLLGDPSVRGYVLNGSDVTEARQSAEDLAAARDGALLASKAKSEFLSTMSHEIRTPMNGVLGLTELLLTTQLDGEQYELASGIRVSAESLLGIINDILDFSKIEAGKLDLEEAHLDLPGMVDDVGRILATAAHKKGLELIVDIPGEVPAAVIGDAMRLQQVLLNLGSNAVKFTHEGEVVIRVVVLHQDSERVALRFEVVDMGIGIAPEDQRRLFQAFAQADSSTTRRFGGTGLGLAISRQLVELMGGQLGLISAPGEGSTFWFEVSFLRAESDRPQRNELGARTIAGQRALIVDDNATNRRILRQQLTSWGVDAVEAADAYEAVALAVSAAEAGSPFDLGVVDLNMPGMDGMELAQILKSDPSTASTTLFLLSSSGERLGAAESHLRGFAASLTKPVRSSELFDCLITNQSRVKQSHSYPPRSSDPVESTVASGLVLLVEDNKMNQLVGSKTLAKLGYACDIADNGREAVEAIRATTYDAVLMDCQMPEMDGYEATIEIRRWEGPNRHIPIIAMTAAAMEGDRDTCIAAGMDDYITKPVRIEAVGAALSRWIARAPETGDTVLRGGTPDSLDRGQLDRLRELDDGDGTLLDEIIEQFLAQTVQGRTQLGRAANSRDAKALERIAHTIKGASTNLGATGLAGVCAEIEDCGRRGELDRAPEFVEQFDTQFALVREALTLLSVGTRT